MRVSIKHFLFKDRQSINKYLKEETDINPLIFEKIDIREVAIETEKSRIMDNTLFFKSQSRQIQYSFLPKDLQYQSKEDNFKLEKLNSSFQQESSREYLAIQESNMDDQFTGWKEDPAKQVLIIENLQAIVKLGKVKDEKGEIVAIPPLNFIGDTYEEFIENKAMSFLLLSVHPYYRDIVSTEDVRTVNQAVKLRRSYVSYFSLFTILSIYGVSLSLYRRNPVFGLTYSSSWGAFLTKYYLFPKLVTTFADTYVFHSQQERQAQVISKKYEFGNEMKQNPICKKAFNDFIEVRQLNRQLNKNELVPENKN